MMRSTNAQQARCISARHGPARASLKSEKCTEASRPKLKSNVLPLDIPQIVQSLPKLPPKLLRIDIANDQCADGRHLRLLCARRERPGCRTAEQGDERAPFHLRTHSITSSARASRLSGTVRPSVLAVLRLMTSSYLVGACTGR